MLNRRTSNPCVWITGRAAVVIIQTAMAREAEREARLSTFRGWLRVIQLPFRTLEASHDA